MKRLILSVTVLAFAVTACKKNNDKGFDPRGAQAGTLDLPEVVLPQIISSDMFLDNQHLWILDGKSYVTGNKTLVIQEGTRIEAIKKSTNDSASALIVTRGSKVEALGTSEAPIVFTSHQDVAATGDWGGIVLLGKAPLNREDATIEGINLPSVPAGVDINYGGGGKGLGFPDDNSGTLQFVRIEYAGAAIATDNELNGLTCGGVGNGTTLDHIEVAYGNDDAFEFFGGTVNAKYLFALAPDDDAFDFDFGYSGQIQFAVSVLNPAENYSANPNGIESDNNGTGDTASPYTRPVISNMTVIGLATSSLASAEPILSGAHFRRRSTYDVRNSIFIGFPTGVRLESDVTQANIANFKNNIIQGFTLVLNPNSLIGSLPASNTTYLGGDANDNVNLFAPFNYSSLDFRPNSGSPALSGYDFTGLPTDFFEVVDYRGAFGEYNSDPTVNNWLAGWTQFVY
jgi:hypothetical protein